MVLDRVGSLFTVIDVDEYGDNQPINLHPMTATWRQYCNGDLYYSVFPTPIEVYPIEERQIKVAELVIICRPICLKCRFNNPN
jgi:hypothetical protein